MKNHEVVECGNAMSAASAVWSPAFGSDRYDVVNAAACQVIGPLAPATYRLTARRCDCASVTLTDTASLSVVRPAATVTDRRPAKVSARLVPGMTLPPMRCRPTYARPNVTGRVPNSLVSRMRQLVPSTLGCTIMRSVWFCAWLSGNAAVNRGAVFPGPAGPVGPGWATEYPTG